MRRSRPRGTEGTRETSFNPVRICQSVKRSSPIARRAPIRRGKGKRQGWNSTLRPRNPERLGRLKEKQFGRRAEWIRSQACATCMAPPRSECSHVRSRGAGGTADDLIPQCQGCHRELHAHGRETFEERYQVDLAKLAACYAAMWRAVRVRMLVVIEDSARSLQG